MKEQAAIEGREQVPELQGDTEKVWCNGKGGGFNEIRCKQKNSYRSRTCSLPSLQNDGRMNIFMGYGDFH